ncbi:MAG: family intrarane metalloprotease [Clostridia bacterium]|nr:family intrarane metalloprotease [Clostridia bacterium]
MLYQLKKNTKIITFEDEKKNEHIKFVFNAVFMVSCFICIMQTIFRAPMYFFIDSMSNQPYYFYVKTLFYLIFSGLSVFIPFFIYNKALDKKVKILFKKEHLKIPLAYYILGIIAVTGIGIFIYKLSTDLTVYMKTLGFILNEEYPPLGKNIFEQLYFIILSAVIPALLNEITFRGIIVENLKKESYTASIIISSMIFSFNNISFELIPYLFVTGLILGWLYIKTDSIYITLFAHITLNIALSILWLFRNTATEEYLLIISNFIIPIAGIIGVLSLIILIIKYKFSKERTEPGLTTAETVKGVLISAGLWFFLFITVFQIFLRYVDKPTKEDEDITNETKVVYYIDNEI